MNKTQQLKEAISELVPEIKTDISISKKDFDFSDGEGTVLFKKGRPITLEDVLIALEEYCKNNFVDKSYGRNKFRVYVDELTNYSHRNRKRWKPNKNLNEQSKELINFLIKILNIK